MDAIAHAATRRLDSSLHAVGTPTPAIPVEKCADVVRDRGLPAVRGWTQGVAVEWRQRRAEQRLKVSVPLTRLHLVHVDANGVARLKLRPQFKMSTDQRIIKIKLAPVYDHPPAIDELFQDAARNHDSSARITRSGRPRRPPGARRSTNGGIRWRWSSSAIRIGGPSSIRLRRSVAARS